MKQFREFLSRPLVTVALLVLALALLGGSAVGGARAALTAESEYYNSHVETNSMDVVLMENGVEVEGDGALLTNLLANGGDTELKIGKQYAESLAVANVGTIDEYVRVSVYRYWVDEAGEKFPDMESGWIELSFLTDGGWSIDAESTTEERTVLYYAPVLASGETSAAFLEGVSINEKAARKVSQTSAGGVITTTYEYQGKQFCLDVVVDGVQTHSADSAKLSAWGVNK